MKTIATAAVLMMLSAPALADEPSNANDAANTDEPILLSEAEMDGVTAGIGNSVKSQLRGYDLGPPFPASDSSTTTTSYSLD